MPKPCFSAMDVLVVGGSGRVGGSTLKWLSKLAPSLELSVGGRSEQSFQAARSRLPAQCEFVQVDLDGGDVALAEAVAGSSNEEDGARHHLVQFVARPVFYLATREAVGDDASLEAALRKACGVAADALSNGKFTALEVLRSGSNVDELPEELRHVITAARPLLLRRVGRTLTPRTDALRNSQKAYDAVPRHTLTTALRAGVVPNMRAFVASIASEARAPHRGRARRGRSRRSRSPRDASAGARGRRASRVSCAG